MADKYLVGKRALVTGSTQGIGFAIAKMLAGAGASIGLHGLATKKQIESARAAVRDCGAGEVRFFDADLTNTAAIASMMKSAESWGGGLDILVNNAGIQYPAPLPEVDEALWNKIIAINLSAPFHTMRRTLPKMAKRGFGRVVNIASVQGLVGSTFKGPYVSAKHGLVGLSKVAALEYAANGSASSGGVTVNCICPGFTVTPIIIPQIEARSKELGCGEDEAIADLLREKQPSRRMSDPSEIGALAVWLCSHAAHNVTGTAIPIDGGWTTQ